MYLSFAITEKHTSDRTFRRESAWTERRISLRDKSAKSVNEALRNHHLTHMVEVPDYIREYSKEQLIELTDSLHRSPHCMDLNAVRMELLKLSKSNDQGGN